MLLCFTKAQPQTASQVWLGYYQQHRLNTRWILQSDVQYRTREKFINGTSQFLLRTGLLYQFNTTVTAGGGFACFSNYTGSSGSGIFRPENRTWQQLLLNQISSRRDLIHSIRFEQRYFRRLNNKGQLAEGHEMNARIRYQLKAVYHLYRHGKPLRWEILWSNEIFASAQNQFRNWNADQDRFFSGVQFRVNRSALLQAGLQYMWQYNLRTETWKNAWALRLYCIRNTGATNKKRKNE